MKRKIYQANREIGRKIRLARKIRGVSQTELGKVLGVTKQTISQYEEGIIKVPDDKLKKIAEYLKKPLRYFLSGKIDEPDEEWDVKPVREDPVSLGMRIRLARIEKGYSQREIAEKLKIGYITYNKYELNKSYPPIPVLKKIAEILEKPLSYFLGEGAEGKEIKETYMVPPKHYIYVPVYGDVKAGEPDIIVKSLDDLPVKEFLPIPKVLLKGKNVDGAFYVISDSMEPKIPKHSYILVNSKELVKDMDVAMIWIEDEGVTVKRVHFLITEVQLIPENKKYGVITLKADKIRILGKVIGVLNLEI